MIFVFTHDLMFGSQASEAATPRGMALQTYSSGTALVEAVRSWRGSSLSDSDNSTENRPAWIVVDLTTPDLDLVEMKAQLEALSTNLKLVAVGPHVHKNRLQAAAGAGWQVFTRGQFHSRFADIISP